MKIIDAMTMASALVLTAGCAHEEQSVQTGDSSYSSASYATPPVGGSYSADGSYSSGGGGSYASNPMTSSGSSGGSYSGTVRADGTYVPNTPADSSLAGAAYSTSGGSDSDNNLVAQVRESLRQNPEMALIAPNIQVSAHNGAIILNGSCQSEGQKRQILAKVQTVAGVVAVNNQLNVMAGPSGENQNDLIPTGNSSERLYKDAANGQDPSTNNVLNSTSRPNGETQIYQQSGTNIDSNGGMRENTLWQNGQNQTPTNNVQPMP